MEVPAACAPGELLRRGLAAEAPAWRWLKAAAASLASREAARAEVLAGAGDGRRG